MNKKQLSAEKTRKRIIDVAAGIISAEGVTALTSRNLIKKAEISKGALYHHFDSLDDVVLAVIAENSSLSDYEKRISELVATGSLLLSDFLDFMEYHLYCQLDNQLGQMLFEAKVLPKVITNDYMRSEIDKINRGITDRLAEAIVVDCDNAEKKTLVTLIYCTASGVALNHLISRDQKAAKARWILFKSMTLKQYGPH